MADDVFLAADNRERKNRNRAVGIGFVVGDKERVVQVGRTVQVGGVDDLVVKIADFDDRFRIFGFALGQIYGLKKRQVVRPAQRGALRLIETVIQTEEIIVIQGVEKAAVGVAYVGGRVHDVFDDDSKILLGNEKIVELQ